MKRKVILLLLTPFMLILFLPAQSYAINLAQTQALGGMVVPVDDLQGLSPSDSAASENTAASRAMGGKDYQKIIKTAETYLGKKYCYGCDGPDSFDCSGFTLFVFKTAGIDLPHSASGQAECGAPVEKENLSPGDLVFFSYYNGNSIEHVGIYIGDGEFIHASSSGSKAVVITSLDRQYYLENYRGARRILR